MKSKIAVVAAGTLLVACSPKSDRGEAQKLEVLTEIPQHRIEYSPEEYVAYSTDSPITVDGDLTDKEWGDTPWTNEFVDIEGDLKPDPTYPTRAKMAWDNNYFYFAFEIVEPHIWANLTERDAVIYRDNDIEIFLDPDSDNHFYYEFEMNAINTVWDLMLHKAYRDGTTVFNAYEMRGLKSAVKVYGTVNEPKDIDDKWTVEVAIPWADISEASRHLGAPKGGEQWRVNFSRVNWQVEAKDGKYSKKIDPKTGKKYPEYNWVWSPQGVIAMHQPETWGFVQFSDKKGGNSKEPFVKERDEDLRWAMHQVYYRQKAFKNEFGHFAAEASQLKLDDIKVEGVEFNPTIYLYNGKWEAVQKSFENSTITISYDSRITVQGEK